MGKLIKKKQKKNAETDYAQWTKKMVDFANLRQKISRLQKKCNKKFLQNLRKKSF